MLALYPSDSTWYRPGGSRPTSGDHRKQRCVFHRFRLREGSFTRVGLVEVNQRTSPFRAKAVPWTRKFRWPTSHPPNARRQSLFELNIGAILARGRHRQRRPSSHGVVNAYPARVQPSSPRADGRGLVT